MSDTGISNGLSCKRRGMIEMTSIFTVIGGDSSYGVCVAGGGEWVGGGGWRAGSSTVFSNWSKSKSETVVETQNNNTTSLKTT